LQTLFIIGIGSSGFFAAIGHTFPQAFCLGLQRVHAGGEFVARLPSGACGGLVGKADLWHRLLAHLVQRGQQCGGEHRAVGVRVDGQALERFDNRAFRRADAIGDFAGVDAQGFECVSGILDTAVELDQRARHLVGGFFAGAAPGLHFSLGLFGTVANAEKAVFDLLGLVAQFVERGLIALDGGGHALETEGGIAERARQLAHGECKRVEDAGIAD